MKLFRITVILILLFYTTTVFAQNLKGIVRNASGIPLSGVSVYISELRKTLITDSNGHFQTHLENGEYSMVYKRLGYDILEQRQTINEEEASVLEITLIPNRFYKHTDTPYNKEVMARQIIKKAITNKIYYTSFSAGAYTRGDLMMTDISQWVNSIAGKMDNFNISDLQNKFFRQEIYSNIEYSTPDIYNIRVEGYSGDIADEFNLRSAIGLLDESLYSEKFHGCISPLSSDAFSYYYYVYDGYHMEDGQACHKIEVKPKVKDIELLSGCLYIKDDGNISYANLVRELQAVKFTYAITYQNIDRVYNLPVTYVMNVYFSLLGNRSEVTYLTSLEYNAIGSNEPEIVRPVIERSLNRENIKFDSLAHSRSKLYWDSVRVFPMDTIKTVNIGNLSIRNKTMSKPWYGKILMGDYLCGGDSSKWSIRYGGVKMIFRDYNYVDGFWLGNRFYIQSKLDNKRTLEISPYIYYTTARHRLIGGSDLTYNYMPDKNGIFTLSIGSHTADFNSLSITRYNNYFSSLFLGKNYNSFYQKDYVTVGNTIDLTRKLKISTSFGVERRAGLVNHTDFTLIKRDRITPNIFPNHRFDRTFYSVGLSFAPHADYTIKNNETPLVFHLEYQEGFSSWQTNNSKYRKLKGGVVQNIRLNYFDKIDYKIEAGAFVGPRKSLHFADYQFYGSPDLVFNLGSLFDSFLLLDNYELQANHYWATLSLNYSSKYILLKWLPFMQGKPLFEGLHFKTLYTPEIKFYTEVGYSLNLTRLFGLGVFTSFDNLKYKTTGVRFSLNLQSLMILRE